MSSLQVVDQLLVNWKTLLVFKIHLSMSRTKITEKIGGGDASFV